MSIKTDYVLDAKGLACPMPIVRTKKAINELQNGQVLEVQATDKGSTADIKAWSERTGHQYLGTLEDGGALKHYIRKSESEEKVEKKFPHVISNEELKAILNEREIFLVDVREEAEYAFQHIKDSISIPLGELDSRMNDLNKEAEIFVICRTGNRSDLAAQKLADKGFLNVKNVVPGMSAWTEEKVK
ncbi:sulfurtransferase TusA family protein [Lederbergia wuyishanensis]|uniref:Rhodanese-related sulfurtransferase/TusA-related sulfurtransferase n=1 Tax=Lederbergia wuyishanensis TaxID=1347903 RepID=A0ABU0D3Y9_9BACI|nr:sulfurtransferase TusA family protein [Lederbergia wuyishanensis]MCJ8007728.1 sulfurtransferase TusA family protein [Lederbergia wuyishanensis]MDQ0343109.1 rhodanese-related sulfurtransferase/TusA-related sulfurtransferase [Lederbergia wuyishanensis]